MIKTDPIMDQDILIGQYTLGLLTTSDRERVQALLGNDASAARRALQWEEELLALVDALPLSPPPNTLLEQILSTLDLPFPPPTETPAPDLRQAPPTPKREQSPAVSAVGAEPVRVSPAEPATTAPAQPTTAPVQPLNTRLSPAPLHDVQHSDRKDHVVTPRASEDGPTGMSSTPSPSLTTAKRHSKKVWMGGAAATLAAVALLTLVFLPRRPVEPPVVIVEVAPSKGAILQAPGQSSTPGWVVTIDLGGNVTLTPQVHTEIPEDASVQLWTYNKILPQPRSLGLIDPNQPVAVPSELMGEISDGQFFEMTLEAEGGSPTSEPAGPILFIGQIVTFSQ